MNIEKLQATAKAMVADGKGVLAIDESHATCTKRFEALGVECTEENRRQYRQMLVTAPVEDYISGMILFDETLRQKNDDGTPFVDILKGKGIIPGIKVDKGAKDLALHPGEKVTEGLDGLRDRLAEFAEIGAEFAKWRAVIAIGEAMPSEACIKGNAHALARYAALCQEAGIVPMVEPEILIDGDHNIEECDAVSEKVYQALFAELAEQGVDLTGTILKTSMIVSGKDCPTQADVQEVAEKTVANFVRNCPAELAGIVFLSGGQSNEKSTAHLNAMHNLDVDMPWPLSFSYGRAIQSNALKIWAENQASIIEAQRALAERAKFNSLAAQGKYEASMEG
jgi:fructose-bisphosphate aldolase class I